MQLQNAKQRFEKQGMKLAAVSYDSAAILKDFASRLKIEFPLLADPDSKMIRAFNVLNEEAKGMTKGMAYPGFFYIDRSGVIRDKFFEANYADRFTPNSVIAKLFPELAEEVNGNVEAPHLQLTLAQSDRSAVPGSRVSLILEIQLPQDSHAYSPGVKGYQPIQLTLNASQEVEAATLTYPRSKVLYLKAIKEKVPVFEGKFRLIQDVTVTPSRELIGSLGAEGKTITVAGELKYQVCDKSVCYTPASVPVKWQVLVLPLDMKRSPQAIQHK